MNRVMREIGPMSDAAPAFPTAGKALAPLKASAEAVGLSDFSSLWSGQAASLGCEMGAGEADTKIGRRLGAAARGVGISWLSFAGNCDPRHSHLSPREI
jgi:hypothetical protein